MHQSNRRRAALATLTGTGLTVAVTIAQAFLLIPLCLTYLGTPLYGAWLGAAEWLIWIQLLDLGIPNLLIQRVSAAIGAGDRDVAARWSATGLALLTSLAAVLMLVGMAAAPAVASWAQVPADQTTTFVATFRLGVLASGLLLVANGLLGVARGAQDVGLVNGGQVVGAIVGLVVSAWLLVHGSGLWALGLGLLARAIISLAAGALFLARLTAAPASWWRSVSRTYAVEVATLTPSMASASLGYVLANNSEILLVTTVLGPVPAAVYALTRRSIDGLRSLLDAIAWAVYGGFAHLTSAADRHRAPAVLEDILWGRFALACLSGAVAVAVNRPFVTLLFGPEHFGGLGLTMAFALQMIIGGQSFLANYLLRSAGQVRQGSWLLAIEAVVRCALMTAGLWWAGLVGSPIGAVIASLVMLTIVRKRLRTAVAALDESPARQHASWAPLAAFGVGVGVGALPWPATWPMAGAAAAFVGLCGTAACWVTVRDAPGLRQMLRVRG